MRITLLLLLAILGSCAVSPPESGPRQAAELSGRAPGPAQRCVVTQQTQALRVSATDSHTLLYGDGKVIWANRLGPSCGFSSNTILITEPIGSYYCRGDLVRSFDRFTRIRGPACILSDFVPYAR
jgi:hypothetical protein